MPWSTDQDIPIDKPREIIELELMGASERDSMPPREMDEKLTEAANAIAKSYSNQPNGDYSSCVTLVSVALEQTGSAIGGEFGKLMLSRSNPEAARACKIIYNNQ